MSLRLFHLVITITNQMFINTEVDTRLGEVGVLTVHMCTYMLRSVFYPCGRVTAVWVTTGYVSGHLVSPM